MEDRSTRFVARGVRGGRPAIVWVDQEAFAGRLRSAIHAHGLSYKETARRAQKLLPDGATIGDASVWSYAKGRTLPRRMTHVEALARVLGFSVHGILEADGCAVAPESGEHVPAPWGTAGDLEPDAVPGAPVDFGTLRVVDAGGGRAIVTIHKQLPWQLALEILDLVKGSQPPDPEV